MNKAEFMELYPQAVNMCNLFSIKTRIKLRKFINQVANRAKDKKYYN